MKKAVLRTFDGETIYWDKLIEVADDYDFGDSPHSAHNDGCYSRSVGSNQTILEYDGCLHFYNRDGMALGDLRLALEGARDLPVGFEGNEMLTPTSILASHVRLTVGIVGHTTRAHSRSDAVHAWCDELITRGVMALHQPLDRYKVHVDACEEHYPLRVRHVTVYGDRVVLTTNVEPSTPDPLWMPWTNKLGTYNNYALIAEHCHDVDQYQQAMKRVAPDKLYNLCHEIAMCEEAAFRCANYCMDAGIDEKRVVPLWRAVLKVLADRVGSGTLPTSGDDWYDLIYELEKARED